jgi:hypothetical protein
VRTSGIKYLAELLKGGALDKGDEQYLELAESVLFEHEWHHAASEIACTRAELLARPPLYRAYFGSVEGSRHEEALANASALLWRFDQASMLRKKAEDWMRRLGPGYREFGRWLSTRNFSAGLDRAGRLMTAELPKPTPKPGSSLHAFLFRGTKAYPSMRVVVVNDLGERVTVFRPFPREYGVQILVHSNEHPPPHIHVETEPGGKATRYLWPSMIPFPGDIPLADRHDRGLQKNVAKYRRWIDAKVRKVFGAEA